MNVATVQLWNHSVVIGDDVLFRYLWHGLYVYHSGSKLCHWKQSTQSGRVKLKHHTFIIIQVPGLYRVYGQVSCETDPHQFKIIIIIRNNQ